MIVKVRGPIKCYVMKGVYGPVLCRCTRQHGVALKEDRDVSNFQRKKRIT